jgi:hypothetical protein
MGGTAVVGLLPSVQQVWEFNDVRRAKCLVRIYVTHLSRFQTPINALAQQGSEEAPEDSEPMQWEGKNRNRYKSHLCSLLGVFLQFRKVMGPTGFEPVTFAV